MKKLLILLTFLAAGGANAAEVTSATIDKYNQKCAMCHNGNVPGAPKSHDVAAWEQRLATAGSMEALVASAVKGKGAMPPKGMCFDCTNGDFEALIAYMSAAE